MVRVEYADFDLLVQRAGEGFEARVLRSPVGETGLVSFRLPFDERDLEIFLLKIGRPRSSVRGLASAEASAVREFGGRLFDGVFRGAVRDCLVSSLNQSEGRGVGLRLRLRLADCPELVDLPWECLYDPGRRRHLALSDWTPLIRYLDLPGVVRPLEVTPPLRVLVLVASPTDYPRLDVEQEFRNLHQAVDSLAVAGRLVVDRLPAGTLAALQQQLRRQEYHIFHYVGHGGYDRGADDGVLVLEGSEGRGQQVSGQDLAGLLSDYRTLRLVVLNSCEGARGGVADPYAGTAQSLIQQGIPAVIAMQFEITDTAAIAFSHTFYAAIADGYPVEAATAEARKTVKNSPNPVEWVTPVLYLRAPDGHLFHLTQSSPQPPDTQPDRDQSTPPRAEPTEDPRYLEGVAAFYAGRWQEAVDRFAAVEADHPSDPRVRRRLVQARQRRDLADWYQQGTAAAEQGDWDLAVTAFERITETDSSYQDVAKRLQQASWEQRRHNLIDDVRRMHAAQQWDAVIAAGQQLSALDEASADPDGLVTQAHNALKEAQLATRYTTGLRQLDTDEWIDALQTFADIERDQPGYRDTATFLAQLQQRQEEQQRQETSHNQGHPTADEGMAAGGSTRITITALPYESPLVTHHLAVTGLVTVQSGNRPVVLASVGVDGMARLWDPRTGARVGLPATGRTGPFAALVTVPVQKGPLLLAAGGKDGRILVWNPWAGPEEMRLIDRAGRVRAMAGVALSSDDVLLASGGEDGVRLWDPRTCKLSSRRRPAPRGDTSGSAEKGHAEAAAVHALAAVATPQGVLLAGGGIDGTVRLWDPRTGAPVGSPMTGHDGPVSALAAVATPQGVLLAGGCVDGTVRLWDPRTGAPVGSPMTGHHGPVSALAVVPLPDGRVLLATGSADKTVRLWDPVTGRPAGEPLTGHTDWVRAVAAVPLPDGRVLLASGGLDGAVRLWKLVE